MPQQWDHHWPLPQGDNESAEEFLERKQRRNHLLHTIGNLTMLTQSLNPSVSNKSFQDKKVDILRHSAINLNRFMQDIDDWDEEGIRRRGNDLFELAKGIWPYPSETETQQVNDD